MFDCLFTWVHSSDHTDQTWIDKNVPVSLLYVCAGEKNVDRELILDATTVVLDICVFVLTDLTVMDGRWHVAGHYDVAAEVLLNQVRVQGVRCVWSLIGRT